MLSARFAYVRLPSDWTKACRSFHLSPIHRKFCSVKVESSREERSESRGKSRRRAVGKASSVEVKLGAEDFERLGKALRNGSSRIGADEGPSICSPPIPE